VIQDRVSYRLVPVTCEPEAYRGVPEELKEQRSTIENV
jgi:hypothetical protein